MGGWVDGWMGGWMDGWMGGWVDGWMDGWADGWMDEYFYLTYAIAYMYICIFSILLNR